MNIGRGRLTVPHFETLDYTDWRVGVTYSAAAWAWGPQARGSNASADAYRPTLNSHSRSSASSTVSASLRYGF